MRTNTNDMKINCKQCGSEFEKTHKRVYCSVECRKEHYRIKDKGRKRSGNRKNKQISERYCNMSPDKIMIRKIRKTYNDIKYRCNNPERETYYGLPYVDRDFFIEWTLNCPKFKKLFNKWIESGMNMKITPSIDRVINENGYVDGNMEWITLGDNSRKN